MSRSGHRTARRSWPRRRARALAPWAGLAVGLSALGYGAGASAATLHVPGNASTIQGAIALAADGDTVLVAPGTYQEQVDFLGKSITVRAEQGSLVTTIDGGNAGSVVTITGASAAVLEGFTIENGIGTLVGGSERQGGGVFILNATAKLAGVRVRFNSANYGAGVAVEQGTLTIEDSQIDHNASPTTGFDTFFYGGGVYAYQAGPLVLTNTSVSHNITLDYSYGSGVYADNVTSVTVTDCDVSWNSSGDFVYGGGVYLWSGDSLTVTGSKIQHNSAVDFVYGGGIYADQVPAVTVQNNLITHNTSGDFAYGTGVLAWDVDTVSVVGNTICNNVAGDYIYGGGALIDATGPVTVSYNTFRENRGFDYVYGGGLELWGATSSVVEHNVVVENGGEDFGYGMGLDIWTPNSVVRRNVIARNTATGFAYGGGLLLWDDNGLVEYNTIDANDVEPGAYFFFDGFGGGIELWGDHYTIRGNIVTNNFKSVTGPDAYLQGAGIDYDGFGSDVTLSHNNVWNNGQSPADDYGGGLSPGVGDISVDPLYVSPTDLRVQPGSPVIDAGDPQDEPPACVVSACFNGVQDGSETDIDCGGSCNRCADGMICSVDSDCLSGSCSGGSCEVQTTCLGDVIPSAAAEDDDPAGCEGGGAVADIGASEVGVPCEDGGSSNSGVCTATCPVCGDGVCGACEQISTCNLPASITAVKLRADVAPTGVDGWVALAEGHATLRLFGYALFNDITVTLSGPQGTLPGTLVKSTIDGRKATATFDLNGASVGKYEIHVSRIGQTTVAAQRIQIWPSVPNVRSRFGPTGPSPGRSNTNAWSFHNRGTMGAVTLVAIKPPSQLELGTIKSNPGTFFGAEEHAVIHQQGSLRVVAVHVPAGAGQTLRIVHFWPTANFASGLESFCAGEPNPAQCKQENSTDPQWGVVTGQKMPLGWPVRYEDTVIATVTEDEWSTVSALPIADLLAGAFELDRQRKLSLMAMTSALEPAMDADDLAAVAEKQDLYTQTTYSHWKSVVGRRLSLP